MIKLKQLINELGISNPNKPKFPLKVYKKDWERVTQKLDGLGYVWDLIRAVPLAEYNPFEHALKNEDFVYLLQSTQPYHDKGIVYSKTINDLDILNELGISKPIPRFRTNKELYDYIIKNKNERKRLIDLWFEAVKFKDWAWDEGNKEESIHAWYNDEIDLDTEILIDDGNDNTISFNLNEPSSYGGGNYSYNHKFIMWGSNKIYINYY